MSGLLSASIVAKLSCVAYIVDAEEVVKYDVNSDDNSAVVIRSVSLLKILLISLVLDIL